MSLQMDMYALCTGVLASQKTVSRYSLLNMRYRLHGVLTDSFMMCNLLTCSRFALTD